MTPNINKILALPCNNAASRFGAEMGRRNIIPDNAKPEKLYLQRVTFVDGDYDRGGAYWGAPSDLWCAFSPKDTENDEPVRVFVRANNRQQAQARVLALLADRRSFGWNFIRNS